MAYAGGPGMPLMHHCTDNVQPICHAGCKHQ